MNNTHEKLMKIQKINEKYSNITALRIFEGKRFDNELFAKWKKELEDAE